MSARIVSLGIAGVKVFLGQPPMGLLITPLESAALGPVR